MATRPGLRTARGRRRFIIELCRRRQRPGTGSNLAALMEEGPSMQWPDLRDILDPIPWAVVGAVAARLYMPERATADIDVTVSAGDLTPTETKLAAAGWTRIGDLAIGGSSWRSPEGVALDLLACTQPWCREALAQAQQNPDAQGLPILPLPYLVLLKLTSGRVQDMADVARMLGLADQAVLERVREIVRTHAPEDADDLEALTELGRLETHEE